MCKKVIFIMLLIICLFSSIYVSATLEDPGYSEDGVNDTIKDKVRDTWATISSVIQVICIGCVVTVGIRYMYASADAKADLKKGLSYITIGAAIVFGAVWIVQIIVDAAVTTLK